MTTPERRLVDLLTDAVAQAYERGHWCPAVAALTDIEAACRDPEWAVHTGNRLAERILEIVDSHKGTP